MRSHFIPTQIIKENHERTSNTYAQMCVPTATSQKLIRPSFYGNAVYKRVTPNIPEKSTLAMPSIIALSG
jgi:hypothetical protein